MEYYFDNINEAFSVMWHRMWDKTRGDIIEEPSRNGPVRRSIYPVTTIFRHPRRRVLMHKARDCNPFFHLFESIWMLAGRNEVAWLAKFNKRMMDYSDDGITLVSAYGYRWNKVLENLILQLRENKNTRRAFIPLFYVADSFLNGKDIPCNTGIAFYRRDQFLDMSVFNRSNDMVYGAYGANVVHFSFLQEYIAAAIGAHVGYYAQISSNFHLYTEFEITKRLIGKIDPHPLDPYDVMTDIRESPYLILDSFEDINAWQKDARYFIDIFTNEAPRLFEKTWHTPFFAKIAAPMYYVWHAFTKQRNTERAYALVDLVEAPDWSYAAKMWMENRLEDRRRRAETDGT